MYIYIYDYIYMIIYMIIYIHDYIYMLIYSIYIHIIYMVYTNDMVHGQLLIFLFLAPSIGARIPVGSHQGQGQGGGCNHQKSRWEQASMGTKPTKP